MNDQPHWPCPCGVGDVYLARLDRLKCFLSFLKLLGKLIADAEELSDLFALVNERIRRVNIGLLHVPEALLVGEGGLNAQIY